MLRSTRRAAFKESIERSMAAFDAVVKSRVESYLHGDVIAVEGRTGRVNTWLDKYCGIDLLCKTERGVWGIASRVQFVSEKNPYYRTFTVRSKRDSGTVTEFVKRDVAQRRGFLSPHYVLQAYVSDEARPYLFGWAIAKQNDVLECAEKGLCKERHTGEGQIGQASFYAVSWYEMREVGFEIHVEDWHGDISRRAA
jgi:hypothetical protein